MNAAELRECAEIVRADCCFDLADQLSDLADAVEEGRVSLEPAVVKAVGPKLPPPPSWLGHGV